MNLRPMFTFIAGLVCGMLVVTYEFAQMGFITL